LFSILAPLFSELTLLLHIMAPFWEKSKGFFKRVKNHDVQAGKPPDIIAGSAGLTKNTPKSSQVPMGPDSKVDDQIDSPIVRSASLTQQSPSIDLPTPSPEATPKVSTLENASRPAHSVPSSLRGSLWNQAYDLLKVEESDLVDAYERILSRELGKGEWDAVDLEPQNNVIGQGNSEQRRSQMMRLIQAGLDKTGKEATVKQKISDGMQVVQSVRGIIDRAVKASPEASLAWVGVCFGLEV
jgi:hypothetical protein